MESTVVMDYNVKELLLLLQDPRVPMSPNLSRALQNQNLKSATYTLPDGTIVDPRNQVISHTQSFL